MMPAPVKKHDKFSLRMSANDSGTAELLIYDQIGFWGIEAKNIAYTLKNLRSEGNTITHINVRINSAGGEVYDGLAIYNLLKQDSASVTVHVDGWAASIASIIALAGDRVIVGEGAAYMIHNPATFVSGNADELKSVADHLEHIKRAIVDIYASRSSKPEDEIARLMDEETWYFGQEVVDAGFADAVTKSPSMIASIDPDVSRRFTHIPERAKVFLGKKSNPPSLDGTVTVTSHTEPQQENTSMSTPADSRQPENNKPSENETKTPEKPSAEQARMDAVKAVFSPFDNKHQALLIECLGDVSCTATMAREKLLNKLAEGTEPSGAPNHPGHAGNGRIVFDSMTNALQARVFNDVKAEKDNPYKSMNLREMARACLTEKGVGAASLDTPMMMVGMAFTHSSSDFGAVLADVAHKAMLRGYEESPETFERWTREGVLTDFKPLSRVGLNTFPSLRKVNENAEYKYASVGDRGEKIVLATYGELFSISREAIINDDLSVFSRLPQAMGRAANRTVGDLVYGLLIDNVDMSDGKALFDGTRKNSVTGGLSVAGLNSARTLMRTHKDGKAHLNIAPGYLLTPVALEGSARSLLNSETDPAQANSGVRNPVNGMAEVISEARLDSASATTSYLVAGDGYDTIEVAWLDGNKSPRFEQKEGWNIDGTEFKISIDAGCSPLDFRTFVKISK